jgi:hypothetical protein
MKYSASLVFPPLAGLVFDNHSILVYYCSCAVAGSGVLCVVFASRLFDKLPAPIPVQDKTEELSVADSALAVEASTIDQDRSITIDRV